MRNTALALVLAASLPMFQVSVARAQEAAPVASAASAKDHFDRGMIFYNVQDWPSAVRELRLAYEGDPKPEYLYSLGQAQRLSGDCASAILTYRSFLRTATGKASAAAEGFAHVCEAQLKTQAEAAAAKAVVVAPVPPVGAAPAAPVSPAPPAPPPSRNTLWIADPLGDTLAVVGIAGVAVGTVFFMQARSNSSNATAGLEGNWSSDQSAAKTDSIVGAVGVGAGALFLVGAVWRYAAVGSRSKEQTPAPSVGFSVGHGGLQLSYGSSF